MSGLQDLQNPYAFIERDIAIYERRKLEYWMSKYQGELTSCRVDDKPDPGEKKLKLSKNVLWDWLSGAVDELPDIPKLPEPVIKGVSAAQHLNAADAVAKADWEKVSTRRGN